MKAVHHRILLFLLGLVLVPTVAIAIILLARGYRPDFAGRKLQITGILAATSLPEGAQVYIDGKLTTATNANLNLPVGNYQVEIKKAGFQSWKKTLRVDGEIVTPARATLFPSVPSLKAVSFTGVAHPIPAPDGVKTVFVYPHQKLADIYVLDLTESPLGLLNRDPKLLLANTPYPTEITWAPDAKQLLLIATGAATLVDINDGREKVVALDQATKLRQQWQVGSLLRSRQNLVLLPAIMQEVLATAAGQIIWPPKENRVLYTATASAVIPDKLITPLPGSNSQPESRQLIPDNWYVYDIEEDKNFAFAKIDPKITYIWLPDSAHILKAEAGKVSVTEYDGTNETVVYAGPMEGNFAYPYPSGKQFLILTRLPATSTLPNLFAVSLR